MQALRALGPVGVGDQLVFKNLPLIKARRYEDHVKVVVFGYRKMIQLQVHLQLPCYDFCFLY
jgi:hypothetical protein